LRDEEAAARGYPSQQFEYQGERVVERRELAGCDQRFEARLLDGSILVGALHRLGHREVLQRRECALEPGLAGHPGLVDLGRERAGMVGGPQRVPLLAHQRRERFSPRTLMRRGDEHAIDVEDDADATALAALLHPRVPVLPDRRQAATVAPGSAFA